jgi:hypothetical protein
MRGLVDTVAFIHKPPNKEIVVKTLMKNLRLKSLQDAETGYQSLQWLDNLDIKPTIPGIQNMARLLAIGNPKVKTVKMEDVVDEAPWQRLEKSPFYKELVATANR